MESEVFSQRLLELIESRGKTPSAVGYAVGITPATMSRYISNTRYPDLRYVIRLCKYFNVSLEWILGLSDDKFDAEGPEVTELVNLYSLASEDDRAVVQAVLAKYKRSGSKEG